MRTPYIIGITGGSGSGKTHFINRLSARFQPGELCLLSQDHYYKAFEQQFVDENGVQNFDLPTALERERFLDDILLGALADAGSSGQIRFDDPDYVLLIETVGGSGGIALWTGEDLKRYPFLGAA